MARIPGPHPGDTGSNPVRATRGVPELQLRQHLPRGSLAQQAEHRNEDPVVRVRVPGEPPRTISTTTAARAPGTRRLAALAQLAEATGRGPVQSGFDSPGPHAILVGTGTFPVGVAGSTTAFGSVGPGSSPGPGAGRTRRPLVQPARHRVLIEESEVRLLPGAHLEGWPSQARRGSRFGVGSNRAPSAHENEVEHGGLCSALMTRRTRFDSWHLDEHDTGSVVVQGGLAESGKATVPKTVVGRDERSRRFNSCILRRTRAAARRVPGRWLDWSEPPTLTRQVRNP
jgi:hypothetical protein